MNFLVDLEHFEGMLGAMKEPQHEVNTTSNQEFHHQSALLSSADMTDQALTRIPNFT